MTQFQIEQPIFYVEAKIADVLILLIDGYKKSGGEISAALGVNQATISRLKNKTQNSSLVMLRAVEDLKRQIESEMRDLISLKAKEAGMTVEEFELCCVGRVGHEVLEEFRDKSKPPVEEGRRGFVFTSQGAMRIRTTVEEKGKKLLSKGAKPVCRCGKSRASWARCCRDIRARWWRLNRGSRPSQRTTDFRA